MGVLTWSRGAIGFVGSVFEVMTQVDLGLTSVSWFARLIRSLVVMIAN
jgi:hypothetical protein